MSELHEMLEGATAEDVNGDPINLYDRFTAIKQSARGWLAEYDKNGFEHSARIDGYLDKFTKEARKQNRLHPVEAFILLCAAYMHDLGYMLDEKLEPSDHPQRSGEMVRDNPVDYLLDDFRQRENSSAMAIAIGIVCNGHSEEKHCHLEDIPNNYPDQAICDHPIDLRRLTAYLRLADEADDPYFRLKPGSSHSIRSQVALVEIGEEVISWHWEERCDGSQDNFRSLIDDKNESLKTSIDYIRSAGLGKWHVVPDPPLPPKGSSKISNIPYRRNVNFTGRKGYLDDLHGSLKADTNVCVVQAITGLGGIGKTQLALEYCYSHIENYEIIWWFESEETATLDTGFLKLAEELQIPLEDDPTIEEVIARVYARLGQEGSWLLVFDNMDDKSNINKYIPKTSSGNLIISSRDPNWREICIPLPLQQMEETEAVEYLLKRSGKGDEESARNLARELGFLPLALAQAGAYLESHPIGYRRYLELYREYEHKLLEQGGIPTGYDATVATTWEMSFQSIEQESPAAAAFLNLCSFLAPDEIAIRVLADGVDNLTEPLRTIASDEPELIEAASVLYKYSLVEDVHGGISIHRLVQDVTRNRLSDEAKLEWANAALNVVDNSFDYNIDEIDTWNKSRTLLPHALVILEHSEALSIFNQTRISLLTKAGLYIQDILADYNTAMHCFEQALEIGEKTLGPDHPELPTMMNNIGAVLIHLGRFQNGKEHLERALGIGEKKFGPDHPLVATIVNNLGTALKNLEDFQGAKECFERALAIDEKKYGPDHPKVAKDLVNLGGALRRLGDFERAKECIERTLAIDEKTYGPDHPIVSIDVCNLGAVFFESGDSRSAKECHERALAIDEKAYGPDDPHVAQDLSNLGYVCRHEDLESARKYEARALAIDEQAYGSDHPNVALRLSNLGVLLLDLEDAKGAKKCFGRALAIDENTRGPSHPDVARDVRNLGVAIRQLGEFEQAKQYFERALVIDERTYGPDHLIVATDAHNLGAALQDLGDFKRAQECFERAEQIRKRSR